MNRTPDFSAMKSIKSSEQKKEEAREANVRADIEQIDVVLKNADKNEMLDLHLFLDGKYQACIINWHQSAYGFVPGYGFNYDVIDRESLIHNLRLMKPKLEAFITGWNVNSQPIASTAVPEINVNTTTNVNINITFEQVRSKIEDMTSLTDEQTKEALGKVSEIEAVVNGNGSKKSKWERMKPILIWLADKSFDVAMTMLPLLLKLQ